MLDCHLTDWESAKIVNRDGEYHELSYLYGKVLAHNYTDRD